MNKNGNDKLISECDFVVLDFETTGLKPSHARVIEIGAVKISRGKITDTFSSFVNPGVEIPRSLSAFTGINTEDLHDAPYFEDLIYEVKSFIGDLPIVAHNAAFDFSFLESEFIRAGFEPPTNKTVCTAKIARRLFPETKSKSLAALTRKFRILHKNAHRALSDATATAKVFLKMLPLLEENYGIRTLGELVKFQNIPNKKTGIKFVKKSLASDSANAPDAPGVYFYKDKNGEIIYIGKAKSLRKRIQSYFLSTANEKAKAIVKKAKNLEFRATATELTALLAETKLIKRHKPEFNSQLKKFPQTYFIKINRAKQFPRPQTVSRLKADGADYFGPYRNRETAHDMLEIIGKAFLLRECTEKEFARKKTCYLAEINRCLAPCVREDVKRYENELENVYRFLSGENQNALNILLEKMKILSSQKRFEEAAEVRDAVQTLLNQLKRTAILAEPINKANAIVEIKGAGKNDYLLFLDGEFYIKNDITETRDFFLEALQDYFSNTLKYKGEITPESVEYFKIALSWLNSHRDLINIYYLKNYRSLEELFLAMSDLR